MTIDKDIKKYSEIVEKQMFELRKCNDEGIYRLRKSSYLASEKVRIDLIRLDISLKKIERRKNESRTEEIKKED